MGLLGRVAGRLRPKRKLNIPVIEVGSVLPAVEVEVVPPNATTEGLAESVSLNIAEALGEGKSFLIGMPGAFTPTCTDLHLPGLIQSAKTLGDYGVSNIAVVTTNDRWVISAWRDSLRNCVGFGDSSLTYLADGDGDLVKALGLVEDMGFGVGLRSKRFALMVEDGVVTRVEVDEGMDELRHFLDTS